MSVLSVTFTDCAGGTVTAFLLRMNARLAKKFSFQPVQLQVNEHGLLHLSVRRRSLRLPVELPPNATWAQIARVWMGRLVDFLFED